MGEYYLIVNPVKRQYLDAIRFGENIKRGGLLQGHHGIAVALLLLDTQRHPSSLVGAWMGDPVIVVGDEAPAHTTLLQTATLDQPERNFYALAQEEFEDISHRAIVMVCEDRKGRIDNFVNQAKNDSSLLVELGDIVLYLQYQPLALALKRLIGSDWTKAYGAAIKHYRLRRLLT